MLLNSKLQVNTHYLAISAVIVVLYDVSLNLGVGSIVVPNFLFSRDVTADLLCLFKTVYSWSSLRRRVLHAPSTLRSLMDIMYCSSSISYPFPWWVASQRSLLLSGGVPDQPLQVAGHIHHASSIVFVQRLCDRLKNHPAVEFYDEEERGNLVGALYRYSLRFFSLCLHLVSPTYSHFAYLGA